MFLFFGTTLIGLALDLWTKVVAVKKLDEPGKAIEFIPGLLQFTYTENHGAVFGIGQGQRVLFIIVSVAAIGFLTYLFATSQRQRWYQFLLGLLLAGVLGNMWDRITLGYVRDMIHALPGVKWPGWLVERLPEWQWKYQDVFPWIFNVADSMLCSGVFLLVIYSFFHRPPESKPGTQDDRT